MLRNSVEGRHLIRQFRARKMVPGRFTLPGDSTKQHVVKFTDSDTGYQYYRTNLNRLACYKPQEGRTDFLNKKRDQFVAAWPIEHETINRFMALQRGDVVEPNEISRYVWAAFLGGAIGLCVALASGVIGAGILVGAAFFGGIQAALAHSAEYKRSWPGPLYVAFTEIIPDGGF